MRILFLEDSCSCAVKMQHSSDNTTDTINLALFVNGNNEYEQGQLLGFQPYGNQHSHTGGRNDRTAPTRRHGHVRNMSCAAGLTHAFTLQVLTHRIKMFVQKTVLLEIFEFVTSSLFQKRFLLVLLLLVHRTRLTNAY